MKLHARYIMGGVIVIFMVLCFSQCNTPKEQGKLLYQKHCESCHLEDGSGLKQIIPPLADADYLTKEKDQLACLIRHGIKGEIIVNGMAFNDSMPSNFGLNDVEITNIINYISTSWGNKGEYVKLEDVRDALLNCDKLQ